MLKHPKLLFVAVACKKMEVKRLFFCLKLHTDTLKYELCRFILYFCKKK